MTIQYISTNVNPEDRITASVTNVQQGTTSGFRTFFREPGNRALRDNLSFDTSRTIGSIARDPIEAPERSTFDIEFFPNNGRTTQFSSCLLYTSPSPRD